MTANTFSPFTIWRRGWLALVALAWTSYVFCGEIHDAARSGDVARIKALLQAKADLVLSKDTNQLTALHGAARFGKKEVTELLLTARADVNARKSAGRTPLYFAEVGGYKEVVELLRQRGGHK